MKKILFLNLPHKDKIVRRYMCSYNSPKFLFPPYELIGLASCVRDRGLAEVKFLDAIAEDKSENDVTALINEWRPFMVVSITGIESIQHDIECVKRLKQSSSGVMFSVFGYYPTIFSSEILSEGIDLILRNEPEEGLSEYLKALRNGRDITEVGGIALKDSTGRAVVNQDARITDLDALPAADYSLVDIKKYSEMLLGGPLAVIQSARGCPFPCAYCITTHGKRVVFKSAGTVVNEIEKVIKAGARVIRFIDDTFNLDKRRVTEICEGMLAKGLKVKWSCLSRVDTLDIDVLRLMKKAGCRRVYIGIESYSQKILDYFRKNYKAGEINDKLRMVRAAGLEGAGFVMVGLPNEEEEDFQATLKGVLAAPLDFIIATKIVPYPGTPMYEKEKNNSDFSLMPYRCDFRNGRPSSEVMRLEKEIYRKFYLRPGMFVRMAGILAGCPGQSLSLAWDFLKFIFKPKTDKDHPDFL